MLGSLWFLSPLQVSLALTRAVKFQRVSMDGGYNHANVQILVEQSRDTIQSLATCSRVMKAILAMGKG